MSLLDSVSEKCIMISIPSGRSIKYFLDTQLYDLLRQHFTVLIFSSIHDLPNFQNTYGGPNVLFFAHPGVSNKIKRKLASLIHRHYGYFASAFRLKRLNDNKHYIRRQKVLTPKRLMFSKIIYEGLNVVGGWPVLNGASKWLFRSDYYERLFSKYHPSLVISTNPKADMRDLCLQYVAAKHGIPITFFPSSWDDFTMKGEFAFKPDRIFSWGPEMTRQSIEYFNMDKKSVVDIGMVRLERMHNDTMTKAEFKYSMNIPNENRTILFAVNADLNNKSEPEVLAALIEDISHEQLGKATLILRLNSVHGEKQTTYLRQYKGLPNVRISLPEEDGLVTAWNPNTVSWNSVIANVDVIITIASMMVIEAFNWDRPVVNITSKYALIDENVDRNDFEPYYGRDVYKKVIECKATLFADNRKNLIFAINRYLDHPELHRENRRHALEFWDVQPKQGISRSQRAFMEIGSMLDEPMK